MKQADREIIALLSEIKDAGAAAESDPTALKIANNLSDVADAGAARTNIGAAAVSTVKVYRALLTQSGSSAPVATVLENTLGGTVVWTRTSAGIYRGTLASAFPSAKTMFLCQSIYDPAIDEMYMTTVRGDDNYFAVTTGASAVNSDDVLGALGSFAVQVLVYP